MRTKAVIYLSVLIVMTGLILPSLGPAADRVRIKGSGASFPFLLYGSWFKTYSKDHRNVNIDYQAKGSGAGIKDFLNHTVDFAASDAAMTDEQIKEVEEGVVLLPMTAGEIVLSYNLPDGPDELKLSRDAYTKIFLGEITAWNDPAIAKANPDASLPDTPITVVRRADSSGTTFVFTKHLSEISEDWKSGPGMGTTVNWPSSSKFVAAPKNDGVAATIKQTPGAIGYIEYGYAKLGKLATAALENKAGAFVMPTIESGQAALASVKEMPEDLRVWLPDPEGENAYPIVTYTWMLFYKKYNDPNVAAALRDIVAYCLEDGQKISTKLGYIPLPDNVISVVAEAAKKIQ